MVVTRDRDRLAASAVPAIAHSHDNDSRFSASPARSAKRFVEGPALFVCLEGKKTSVQVAVKVEGSRVFKQKYGMNQLRK